MFPTFSFAPLLRVVLLIFSFVILFVRVQPVADPEYSDVVTLDLSTVVPCLAGVLFCVPYGFRTLHLMFLFMTGPKRPQDRVPLTNVKSDFVEVS